MSQSKARDAIVEVLSRRITDEDVDLGEAALAVIDALRLREEWTWQTVNGERGYEQASRDAVVAATSGIASAPAILFRMVTDWSVED